MGAPTAALPPELAGFARLLAEASEARPGGGEMAVVVAHPDDETIGFGGQLRRMRNSIIVHVTDGSPRSGFDARAHGFAAPEDYAAARRRELEAAVSEVGVPASSLLSLGIPDQDAPRRIADIAKKLAALFGTRKPRFVLTHPFEGGHPDHDATAFGVWAACRLVARGGGMPPAVIEMASYHLGSEGAVWGRFAGDEPELVLTLGPEDLARKQRMFAAHRSQTQVLAQFAVGEERFRLAPAHDFAALPNGGRLLYESKGWGLKGDEWLTLSRVALAALGLQAGRETPA
ncbi:MAG TPA: PIG-L family deacetylase [Mesorhizobium sp.]|jgi:LmbE family N-acetylglucosaminyl deacetylase|nr:PIG-L family deacetylase [Mesorhizobium sp.]